MAYIVGLDLSLRAPGVAILPNQWDLSGDAVFTCVVKDAPKSSCRGERYTKIAGRIVTVIAANVGALTSTRVFIEAAAFSRGHQSAHLELAELGGAVRSALWKELGLRTEDITASHARAVLLGKIPRGTSSAMQKARVREAFERAGAVFTAKGFDESDALAIANAARADLGWAALGC